MIRSRVYEEDRLVRAFVPAHITAFFVPVIRDKPSESGSLGAGVNLDKGTTVFLSPDESSHGIRVLFNGNPVNRSEAVISYAVAEEVTRNHEDRGFEVWQYFDFPNGYGFGNSAGGALGTALVTGYVSSRTLLDVARIAHRYEVIHRGGLGDVVAQLAGGVDIRTKAGEPGVAVVDNIITCGLYVVSIYLGPLKTKDVLDDDVLSSIKNKGKEALKRLLKFPSVPLMMELARGFSEDVGLLDGELASIANELDRVTSVRSSMIMLGRGVFSFVSYKELPAVERLLSDLDVQYDVSKVYCGRPLVEMWRGSPSRKTKSGH